MNEISTLKNLPQDLKMNALFCAWKLTDKGKIPLNVITGGFAKSNDASTFCNYPILLNHIHKYLNYDDNGKQLGGVGLGIFRGFSAVDIDHCVDENGVISPMAKDIIDYCKSYTELSPSKTGIRIIFKTDTRIDKNDYYINNHNNGLEIYISDNTNKFVTLTGNKLSGDNINDIDIKPLLDKYMRKNVFNINNVLSKDDKLKELWFSTASGSHGNESETDMALCCKLAFYLKGDTFEIKKYFEMSPFYQSKDEKHKNKWESNYSLDTINKAVSYIKQPIAPTYQPTHKKFELNDTGNANRFIDQFGDIVRYNVDNDIWMIYNGSFWESDIKGKIKGFAEIMAEQMLYEANLEADLNVKTRYLRNIDRIYNSAGKEALLKEARHLGNIPITNDELDKDQYLICTESGTINLKTGDIQPNNKDDLISMSTGCEISFDEPKLFTKFIHEMFPNNDEVIHYLQKAFGYSMTDSAREQCMFILQGDGNNGKSLLLDIIKSALGSYGITAKPQLLTEQKYSNTNNEEVARMKGKRFVAVEETKAGDKLDEQLIKSLTSGIGNQVARFLYGNSFEFAFKGKIWMATNYEPAVAGTDKGIWRRMRKIPVYVDFTGREDRDLREKLLQELPQILGWIFKGYQMYLQEGLTPPQAVIKATEEYKEDNDLVQQWINEYCEIGSKFYERANVLYDNYRAFLQRRDQKTNQTLFGRNLGKKYKKKIYEGCTVYIGLRLKKGVEDLGKKVAFDSIKIDDDI